MIRTIYMPQGTYCTAKNKENGQKKSLSGKTQGIWKCCQNTGKKQRFWFARVVNSLILKIKDILIFSAKIIHFYKLYNFSKLLTFYADMLYFTRQKISSHLFPLEGIMQAQFSC